MVSKILGLLRARGLVFTPGKFGHRSYYGVAGVLDPKNASLPSELSRRQRVLELVRLTVEKLGRAVRTGDVLENAAGLIDSHDLTSTDIMRDVLNLKETGELRVVGLVRGDGKGINLYLPAELNPEDYAQPSIPTWLEEVAYTFNKLWGERARQAAVEGRKPSPLSTGEVRAHLRSSSRYPENFTNPMILVNAMQQLARTRNPILRKIRRPKQKAVLWAPSGVDDSALNAGDAYASDAERVSEAVRRAENALARPVTVRDVQDQIELDPSLRPAGSSRLISVLSEAAKERIPAGKNGGRSKRVAQHVHRVGKVADVSYYSKGRTPEAEAFIKFKRLELRWSAMRVGDELETLSLCSLPTAAIGRAMLALTETDYIISDLDGLRGEGYFRGEQRQKVDELFSSVTEVVNLAREWLKDHSQKDHRLPQSVNTGVPGWTIDELLEVIKPLYPRSQTLRKNSQLLALMGNTIRRVSNPEYVNRFTSNQRKASEYLFDRTDALIYAAKEWGGYECCLQASLAGNELGLLRDPRFIFPALELQDFNARLAAIACLAFLPSEAGNEHLHRTALNDSDPGVRQSALWAYGFAGGVGASDLLDARSKDDIDARVRTFAKVILEACKESWWVL